jgi:hypothetical protein
MDRLSVQSLSLVESNGDMQFHSQVPFPYDAYTTRISPCWNRPCGALESIQQETCSPNHLSAWWGRPSDARVRSAEFCEHGGCEIWTGPDIPSR